MLRAAIVLIVLATILATYLTDSFIAPPIGAALLFGVMFFGWLFNRGASRSNLREAEEATHREREERGHDDT